MNVMDALNLTLRELSQAEKLHPHWPDDVIHGVAIMVEEAGESMQAAIDQHYKGLPPDHLVEELVQTAAMCVRNIVHLTNTVRIANKG